MFLYEHLEYIKTLLEDKPENIVHRQKALCALINSNLYDMKDQREAGYLYSIFFTFKKQAFKSWEYYSGNSTFPVPKYRAKKLTLLGRILHPIEAARRAEDAEERYKESCFYYVADYGKLRLELLDHLIEYFRERHL